MIQAICWTLLHSLWQGLFFAMITGVIMLLTRRTSAAVRYNLLCGLLMLFLVVCGGTFIYEWRVAGEAVSHDAVFSMGATGGWIAGWIDALGRYCSEHAVLIVWIWLFVFAVKSLRMLGGLLYAQRIRHYGVSAAPEAWQQRVDDLSRQLGIGRVVKLVESSVVKMPLVAGHWRPMIFMPLGLLTGLPEGEIEAVLLHELAHVRRNDLLINFLQHVAGNFLFFNPGFLWISALLRDERENCCDDVAIARTRDKVQFVRALISFKEYDLRMAKVAVAFPARKNQLLRRVSRIAHNNHKTLGTAEKIFLMISFALISLLVVANTGGGSPQNNGKPEEKKMRAEVLPYKEMIESEMPGKDMSVEGIIHRAEKKRVRKVQVEDERLQEEREKKEQEMKADRERAGSDEVQQAMRDRDQAERDRSQAERDKSQAERDKEQAFRDKEQAERDMQQALRDREQAAKDAAQAMKDAAAHRVH